MARWRWRSATAVAVALLGAAGCSAAPVGDQPPSGDGGPPTAATSAQSAATPGTSPSAASPAAPRSVGADQRFAIGDVAEFADGLQIEVAGTVAVEAAASVRGAESTDGQLAVASVRIENNTGEPFDAAGVLISATYGRGRVATVVTDTSGKLTAGFAGPVTDADEAIATVGFAVPKAELRRVTVVVDSNDDDHEPVSFTGPVKPG